MASHPNHEIKVEKTIGKSPHEVFRALAAGRLFQNCSADGQSMAIDFRVGGEYRLQFKAYGFANFGKFLEIIPDRKIVFTWCQTFEPGSEPDTTVTIELKEKSPGNTLLLLIHTGFTDQEGADSHQEGWTGGLKDLTQEICEGKLRIVRAFKAPIDKLYAFCQSPAGFFGNLGDAKMEQLEFRVGGQYRLQAPGGEIRGKFLEIVPGKQIAFTWHSPCGGKSAHETRVTLNFDTEDEGGSSMELIHEGLDTEDTQLSHRRGWESLTNHMLSAVV